MFKYGYFIRKTKKKNGEELFNFQPSRYYLILCNFNIKYYKWKRILRYVTQYDIKTFMLKNYRLD